MPKREIATGKVVVLAPDFPEQAYTLKDLTHALVSLGHDVITVDQTWAGAKHGHQHIDSGYGLARDIAAVAVLAQGIKGRDYREKSEAEVILVGHGIAASAGVLGALVLGASGKINLDGRNMAAGSRGILVSPTFSLHHGFAHRLFDGLGVLNSPWRSGSPTGDGEDFGRMPKAFERIRSDLLEMLSLIDEQGMAEQLGSIEKPIEFIHAQHDPVADFSHSQSVATSLGTAAHFRAVHSHRHALLKMPATVELIADSI